MIMIIIFIMREVMMLKKKLQTCWQCSNLLYYCFIILLLMGVQVKLLRIEDFTLNLLPLMYLFYLIVIFLFIVISISFVLLLTFYQSYRSHLPTFQPYYENEVVIECVIWTLKEEMGLRYPSISVKCLLAFLY